VNQAAWVAVSLGEDVAGEGAGSLATVAMETPIFHLFVQLSFPFSKM